VPCFKHLDLVEREKLYGYLKEGLSLRQASQKLGRNHTTVSRELKRNTRYGRVYLPCLAEKIAARVGFNQRWRAPLKDPLIFLYVREHLRDLWSPEQIAGRLQIDHPDFSIDKETVYRYIYHRRNLREKLWQYLTLIRKKRRKQHGRAVKRSGKISKAVSIDLRPKRIERRKTVGHWETDNMEGIRSDRTVVSVSVERRIHTTLLSQLKSKKASEKTRALTQRMKNLPGSLLKTVTADNGSENSGHETISQRLGVNFYFCHPYRSWEKGTVENTIGRIRRFVPKGISIDNLSEEYLRLIEERMNNTPRKCLGFRTPYEKMEEELLKVSLKATTI